MEGQEDLVLNVTKWASSIAGTSISYELEGNAEFIWNQIGFLLCDPLLCSFSLKRTPQQNKPDVQTYA